MLRVAKLRGLVCPTTGLAISNLCGIKYSLHLFWFFTYEVMYYKVGGCCFGSLKPLSTRRFEIISDEG
ncbi:hypothetical protein MPTK1_2g13990 [Marchantia polymorpha subsp. ruderalis]|uniref:Uncharacterized protein n=1 Tax=Marchantia polymorpha TaxID=3197 RepID=A0A2R6X1L0_MARPO|nr:hypothetical protein MARPO_0042s0027 [Marchantia polymorpha]BBN02276.1 hypothetical protein Mp_2g13990 [Marchantia polymorpha subsp. ruderalis]|eukprot:PTQ39976.1 hypothetical protein MARPO_0042s0027 [Marchantia polymorpha]